MATYEYYSANHKSTLAATTIVPDGLHSSPRLHVMQDSYTIVTTQGASDTVEIEFPALLPGKVVIFGPLSWISVSDAEANCDLHLGYRAYVDSNGDTQAEDHNYWLDDVDIGGGAKQGLLPAITGVTTLGAQYAEFDAQSGLKLFVTFDTGDISATDTVTVSIVYAHIQ